ncbi:hypothetical protein NLJ89_g7342 [Agrocybe chaxingu]|uniref:Right handed beta helix domain-containing protein n=1 Tax=Agrocybe chaxingu TaxID=84603 RepID=A0A9W8MRU7_9AGAR|nr:hypothetical protein NLJ89_g7342 [Agrocybe chaxingu]
MEDFLPRRAPHGSRKRDVDPRLARRQEDCEPADPANTVTDRLNNLLRRGGDGYVLQLCPNQVYLIQAPIAFAYPNQEISTAGYPTGAERAVLAVSGSVADGKGHTTAVDGTCNDCDGVKLRNIQIDGTRRGARSTQGGGNIEFGGDNSNQLIEYVRSYDPRGWSCLHVAEGPFTCKGITIQNNDLGPCGSEEFQEWADGVSLSCRDSIVRNNLIQGATDGGIVVFGSPGSQITNNTIWVLNQTLLGGINMVDYDPWGGDYTGTVVRDNLILGGFANDEPDDNAKGNNLQNAIIKIGIAIGPRSWFGDRFGNNVARNGVVWGNKLSGAFSYGIAITSSEGFVVQDNSMTGNTSFIGARGPYCKDDDIVPNPAPFIVDLQTTRAATLQTGFEPIKDGDSLTCVLPPNGGDFWPVGLNPSNTSTSTSTNRTSSDVTTSTTPPSNNSTGIAVGVVIALVACGVIAWFVHKRIIARKERTQLFNATKGYNYNNEYTQKIS